jgi:2-phosphoglycerate kinase
MDEGYEEDGGATIESLAGLYRCVRELLAERDHLEADLHRERVVKRINDVALLNAVSERDRLRAVVDAVRVMWDNIVDTADEAVMGFPMADYHAIEEALDQLDESAEATDG